MRCSQVLVAFCVLSNLYQSRYIILQVVEICLQTIVWFSVDAHQYIQQQINYSRDIKVCNETNTRYNLSQYEYECPQHQYNIRVIERRPLIIYIEQFLNQDEIQHLIELANPIFVHSGIVQADGLSSIDDNYRSSSTAYLLRSQTAVVKCIEQRFAQFQGNIDPLRLEPLQVVRYGPDQQFKPHVDWFHHPDQMINGGQRLSTIFTYLQANCSMGETEFINIKFSFSLHSQFCKFLICDETAAFHGIRFRPIPGNSIFWFNIDENGYGDNATFHAGLPPGGNGQKIGLNTWIRERVYA